MVQKRDSRRIPYRKRIKLGKTQPTLLAYTSDFSDHGLKIESRNIYPPGTRIVISIPDETGSGEEENSEIIVEGVVRWSKHRLGNMPGKMGIKLIKGTDNRLQEIYKEKVGRLNKT
ncbi:MAG: PilZ domain-containing protein [Deltaproteobacteria bacterium]